MDDDYYAQTQNLQDNMLNFFEAEKATIEDRSLIINSLLQEYSEDPNTREILLGLKKDNDDAFIIVKSFESMTNNRVDADSINRISALAQGYSEFSNEISKDLDRYIPDDTTDMSDGYEGPEEIVEGEYVE